jgi:hypothetical protein
MTMYFNIYFQLRSVNGSMFLLDSILIIKFVLDFESFLSSFDIVVFHFVLRDQKLPSSCKNCPSAKRVSAKNTGCSDFTYLSKQGITLNRIP